MPVRAALAAILCGVSMFVHVDETHASVRTANICDSSKQIIISNETKSLGGPFTSKNVLVCGHPQNIRSHALCGGQHLKFLSTQRRPATGNCPGILVRMQCSRARVQIGRRSYSELCGKWIRDKRDEPVMGNFVRWGLPVIFHEHSNANDFPNSETYRGPYLDGDVRPQLPLGGIFRASDQLPGGPSQDSGENRQNRREYGNRIARGTLPPGFLWFLLMLFVGSCGATGLISWILDQRTRRISKPKRTAKDS